MASNTSEFSVTCDTADGQTLKGTFKVKLRLSHRDTLKMDEYRRSLLGDKPDAAGPEAMGTATVFAKLWTHITESPAWWRDNGNGLDLDDSAPVMAVFEELNRVEREAMEALVKKATEARQDLKSGT